MSASVSQDCPVCHSGGSFHFMRVAPYDYWRCPVCLATFVDRAQLPDTAVEHAEYRLHRNEVHDTGYRQFLARLAVPLLERLRPGSSGLDYGCGPGPALAAMLAEAGHRVAVYDPLFFDHPHLLDETYDFVTCSEVAEHFHDPHAEFAGLDGLLRPGGWLGVMTRFQTDDAAFAGWHYRRDRTHVVFYREATFRVIASRFGWHCEFPAPNIALLQKAGPG